MRDVFDGFPIAGGPNESQTEDDLIWPVLLQLGWTAGLRQQNLSFYGREDVPDGLLFRDAAEKDRANSFPEEWKRYEFGLAVVESKRWLRPLDRRSVQQGEENAPSRQVDYPYFSRSRAPLEHGLSSTRPLSGTGVGGSAFLLLATDQREDRAQRLSSPRARYPWGDLRI